MRKSIFHSFTRAFSSSPLVPLEMLVIFYRKLVRATIHPETLRKILHKEIDRSEESRAFIEKNRTRLELVIKVP